MKFMLLIYMEENAIDEQERQLCYEESTAVCRELHAQGRFVGASPLQPIATAASVRVRQGKPVVTDGPFAETREQLGGYFLVDARDKDEAVAIASRIPGARWGTVEVRPIVELPGLPLGPPPAFAERA
ncbi:YCII-related domain protein [Aquisphaera giovannonii]|uniref:YCII-related domain protein n=1 Tax=Aquisphaera giovannonii TaxID=406548 RepID=A0A5B9VXD4_9BACT|nr:YciI family protein [Aquisphaera giovannonii]QEH32744.1 YCII-related domain protein [Aquisphaera giovannonii]